MMKKTVLVAVPNFDFTRTDDDFGDIFEVEYNSDGLKVRVGPSETSPKVSFSDVVGFRLLNEGDLLEFWPEGSLESNSWVFEVENGGWFDLESLRSGFLSSNRREEIREFIVVTDNDCLSVFSLSVPVLVD